jgi:hypothetical protein
MTTSIQTAPSAMTEAERLAREHLRIFAVGDEAAAAANVSLDYVNLRSLQRFSYSLTRVLTLKAAPHGLGSLRALTPMKTAVCCYSRWSPMSDASRQTLCKVL